MDQDGPQVAEHPEAILPDAVFDCNLFLQAVVNETGPAFACLELVEMKRVVLYLSQELLSEVQDVLTRPALQRKFLPLTPERVNDFIKWLTARVVLITNVPPTFCYSRDPKDEPYINLALVSGAHYLVSRDRDLLDLGTDGGEFKVRFPGLTILNPVAFLERMRKIEES